MTERTELIEEVQTSLGPVARNGLLETLAALNARVPHRYTAVYQLDGSMLRNVCLFDKTGAINEDFLTEVPLGDSFCQFVFKTGKFMTDDSRLDERLDGHPYQGVVISYHAVPVMKADGAIWGSLCHLDLEPRSLAPEEFEYLQLAALALARQVAGPDMPGSM